MSHHSVYLEKGKLISGFSEVPKYFHLVKKEVIELTATRSC